MQFHINGKQVDKSTAKDVFRMAYFKAGFACYDDMADIWQAATSKAQADANEEARDTVFEVTHYTLEIDPY
jgi:hypothetical protein